MEHVDRKGDPKIVPECTFPLTGRECVTRIYTDLAVFHVVDGTLRLVECAPGGDPGATCGRAPPPPTPRTCRDEREIDLSRITAIDVHTHVHRSVHAPAARGQHEPTNGRHTSGSARCRSTRPGDRRVLPRAQDGRGRVHRGQRARRPGGRRCLRTRRSPSLAAEHADVLIPFASIDPRAGQGRRRARRAGWSASTASAGSSSTRAPRASIPTTARPTRCTRSSRSTADRAVPHRPDRHRRRACPAAAGSG